MLPLKWLIRELGFLSVLAGTGAGTGRPRELYLYMTSNRLYEICLMVSITVFWSVEDNVTMIRIGYQGVLPFEIAPRPIDLVLTPRKYINPPALRPTSFLTRFPSPSLSHFLSMCVECVPPELVNLTPRDYDQFFRVVNGRQCNNLNHLYLMPADEGELRVSG
jgi:hypothetical protein